MVSRVDLLSSEQALGHVAAHKLDIGSIALYPGIVCTASWAEPP